MCYAKLHSILLNSPLNRLSRCSKFLPIWILIWNFSNFMYVWPSLTNLVALIRTRALEFSIEPRMSPLPWISSTVDEYERSSNKRRFGWIELHHAMTLTQNSQLKLIFAREFQSRERDDEIKSCILQIYPWWDDAHKWRWWGVERTENDQYQCVKHCIYILVIFF